MSEKEIQQPPQVLEKVVLPLPLGGCGSIIAVAVVILVTLPIWGFLLMLKFTVFPNISYVQLLVVAALVLLVGVVVVVIGGIFGGAWLMDKHDWHKSRKELQSQIQDDGTEQFLNLRARSSLQNIDSGSNRMSRIGLGS